MTPRGPNNPNVRQLRRDGDVAPRTNPTLVPPPRAKLQVLAPRDSVGTGPVFGRFDVDLTNARGAESPASFNVRGNVLIAKASTFATDTAFVRFNGAGAWVPVVAGDAFYGVSFDLVEVYNAAQTSSSLTFIYTTDKPDARALVLTR